MREAQVTTRPAAEMLDVIVLGSAAGGGVPQWNCRCDVCAAAWRDPGLRNGQASVAVSADGGANWFLINASPDLRQQILDTPRLHPTRGTYATARSPA